MKTLECNNANEAYVKTYSHLINNGTSVISRAGLVKEEHNMMIEIVNPRKRYITEPTRNMKIKTQLAEFLWYMTANNNVNIVAKYIPNWREFVDKDQLANSNYGTRFINQVPLLIYKLKNSLTTRQAILTIYDKSFLTYQGNDTPCTLSLQFQVRHKLLNMTVVMRSNDVVFGFCIDQFCFSVLQELIANELGLEVGNYVHVANNMHIYEKHFKLGIKDAEFFYDSPESRTKVRFSTFWRDIESVEPGDLFHDIQNIGIDIEHFKSSKVW